MGSQKGRQRLGERKRGGQKQVKEKVRDRGRGKMGAIRRDEREAQRGREAKSASVMEINGERDKLRSQDRVGGSG